MPSSIDSWPRCLSPAAERLAGALRKPSGARPNADETPGVRPERQRQRWRRALRGQGNSGACQAVSMSLSGREDPCLSDVAAARSDRVSAVAMGPSLPNALPTTNVATNERGGGGPLAAGRAMAACFRFWGKQDRDSGQTRVLRSSRAGTRRTWTWALACGRKRRCEIRTDGVERRPHGSSQW
jgi:hypothetical protein